MTKQELIKAINSEIIDLDLEKVKAGEGGSHSLADALLREKLGMVRTLKLVKQLDELKECEAIIKEYTSFCKQYQCSICSTAFSDVETTPYIRPYYFCPNCGSKIKRD